MMSFLLRQTGAASQVFHEGRIGCRFAVIVERFQEAHCPCLTASRFGHYGGSSEDSQV